MIRSKKACRIWLWLTVILNQPAICQSTTVDIARSGRTWRGALPTVVLGARVDANGATPATPLNQQIALREFTAIQLTYYLFNWKSPTTFNLEGLTTWVNWGHQHGKKVMVHHLVGWNNTAPGWLKNGDWTTRQLANLFERGVRGVVEPTRSGVQIWNVVNESLDDPNDLKDPGKRYGSFRDSKACLWRKLGMEKEASGLAGVELVNDSIPVYIGRAFRLARLLTNAELELREYNMEFSLTHPKSRAFYQLVRHLLRTGVPLDAIGFQCHLSSLNQASYDWVAFRTNIARYKALGLKVYITELDISQGWNQVKSNSPAFASAQKAMYKRFYSEALAAGVSGIFTWGMFDNVDPGWRKDYALPWDSSGQAKPAYYGVLEALHAE